MQDDAPDRGHHLRARFQQPLTQGPDLGSGAGCAGREPACLGFVQSRKNLQHEWVGGLRVITSQRSYARPIK